MSGIAGIVHFDGRPVEPGQIHAMTAAMDYRGPDGIGHWMQGNVALGQCMLRTTPESLEETLPLANEDGSLVLVMDGRIDNWEDLRRELLGRNAHLRTRADAELFLRAYETWGEDCLARIDGDFAVAVWETRTRSLFCARDHIGAKPFFYHLSNERFVFGSEPAAFRNVEGMNLTADIATVAEYIANDWISNTATFWQEIVRLPRATAIRVDQSGIRQKTYWQPSLEQDPVRSAEEYAEEYLHALIVTCRNMMRSHKPLAFEASGGLDSSALFAIADHLERGARLPAPSMHGFTLDFPDDSAANELSHVDAVAAHLSRPVERIAPFVAGLQYYRQLAHGALDFPGYPNGLMALGIRQHARSLGCRTLFSGTGGDEWLGQMYEGLYLTEEVSAGRFRHAWQAMQEDARSVGGIRAIYRMLRHGIYPNSPESARIALRWVRHCGKPHPPPPFHAGEMNAALTRRRQECPAASPPPGAKAVQRMQWKLLHAAYDARARESEERNAALHGLELRWIFHSRRIIQLAFRMPERFRSQPGMTKLIHRHSMREFLPESIRLRPDKADFMTVFARTMAGVRKEELHAVKTRRFHWLRQAPSLQSDLDSWLHGGSAEKDAWRLWSLLGSDLVLTSRRQ